MRPLTFVQLVCSLALIAPPAAWGQSAAPTPVAATPEQQRSTPPQAAKDGAQGTTGTGAETARSLFEPTWHEFTFGGRLNSVAGDPARFQRYADERATKWCPCIPEREERRRIEASARRSE